MRRFAVFVLIVSLGNTSVAFAGDTLLGVATRVAQNQAPPEAKSPAATAAQKNWAARSLAATMSAGNAPSSALAQEQPALSSSGMGKRTKILIFLAAAVGVAATAYTIDRKVENTTPSSLGTRTD